MSPKKLLFLTGTRADFGKLKPLMKLVEESDDFELSIFITGMHMLKEFGSTYHEVLDCNFKNTFQYINQIIGLPMDIILANTIQGLSAYIHESPPDIIVVHGDRLETLAGAIVGSFRNILVAHIEGGEKSGTIDESIRHSVSKLSNLHFVANFDSKKRLIQLGEREENISVIGSPDIDIMKSQNLPDINDVKSYYEIPFENYSIAMFHPVTTEYSNMSHYAKEFAEALLESQENYVVVYPNNDEGMQFILAEYEQLKSNDRFRVFPSLRFEKFLTIMKNADFIIGNSSAGIREAPYYNLPTVNIGTRQNERFNFPTIIQSSYEKNSILRAILKAKNIKYKNTNLEEFDAFGNGNSAELFLDALRNEEIWTASIQKTFNDIII